MMNLALTSHNLHDTTPAVGTGCPVPFSRWRSCRFTAWEASRGRGRDGGTGQALLPRANWDWIGSIGCERNPVVSVVAESGLAARARLAEVGGFRSCEAYGACSPGQGQAGVGARDFSLFAACRLKANVLMESSVPACWLPATSIRRRSSVGAADRGIPWSGRLIAPVVILFLARHSCVLGLPKVVCARGSWCLPCGCSGCWGGASEGPSSSHYNFQGVTRPPVFMGVIRGARLGVGTNRRNPRRPFSLRPARVSRLSHSRRVRSCRDSIHGGVMGSNLQRGADDMRPKEKDLPQESPGGVRPVARVNSRIAARWPVRVDGVVLPRLSGAAGSRSSGKRRHYSGGNSVVGRVGIVKGAGGSGSAGPGSPVVATL